MLNVLPVKNGNRGIEEEAVMAVILIGDGFLLPKQLDYYNWPESSALANAVDFCLTTLPIALPPKIFLLKIA